MEVKKILWPTDLSPNAEKALDYVTSFGEKYQTEVHVLYVIEELGHHEPWYGDLGGPTLKKSTNGKERPRKNGWEISATSIYRAVRCLSNTSPSGIPPKKSSTRRTRKMWT